MKLIKPSSVSDGKCGVIVENLDCYYCFLHNIKLIAQLGNPSVVFGETSEENQNICRSYYRIGKSDEYVGLLRRHVFDIGLRSNILAEELGRNRIRTGVVFQ